MTVDSIKWNEIRLNKRLRSIQHFDKWLGKGSIDVDSFYHRGYHIIRLSFGFPRRKIRLFIDRIQTVRLESGLGRNTGQTSRPCQRDRRFSRIFREIVENVRNSCTVPSINWKDRSLEVSKNTAGTMSLVTTRLQSDDCDGKGIISNTLEHL